METKSLTELVQEIKAGNDQTWPELVQRLSPAVRAAVRRYNVDEEVRNDAIGDVWHTLFERIDSIEDPERLHKWVSVVASNRLVTMLRRPAYLREISSADDVLEVAGSTGDTDRLAQAEVGELLNRAVSRLSPREQVIVRGRVYTDDPDSLASLSCRHNIPTGSIGPTLGRSLNKLRRDPELASFFPELRGRHRSDARRERVSP